MRRSPTAGITCAMWKGLDTISRPYFRFGIAPLAHSISPAPATRRRASGKTWEKARSANTPTPSRCGCNRRGPKSFASAPEFCADRLFHRVHEARAKRLDLDVRKGFVGRLNGDLDRHRLHSLGHALALIDVEDAGLGDERLIGAQNGSDKVARRS